MILERKSRREANSTRTRVLRVQGLNGFDRMAMIDDYIAFGQQVRACRSVQRFHRTMSQLN